MNTFDYVKVKKTGEVGRIREYISAFSEDHYKVNGRWYEDYELEFYAENDGGALEQQLNGEKK